ncbi:hypothetical protein [Dysgonomonas sp. 520]|nr:hypothetical protein [Dysgonomonas sp. 520]
MANCEKCEELLSILKEIKRFMDSDDYLAEFDDLYDKIANAIEQN